MVQEYPLNAELDEDTGHEETTGRAIDDNDIEALREKAFTPEFRELVSKITGHSVREKSVHELSREELLQKYHTLFYQTSNLLDLDTINNSFNQFSFHEDALFDSLCSHLHKIMKRNGFPFFVFLSFDFEKSSYVPVFHTVEDAADGSIVFDIHENLIKRIFSSKQGIWLTRDAIETDPYLRKRMTCSGNNPDCAYYFCAVRTIAERVFDSGKNIARIADAVGNSAVIMVSVDAQTELQRVDNIFDIISHNLSLHLILLSHLVMKRQAAYSITGLERSITVLDYLFTMYKVLGSGSIYVLRCNECRTREFYYTFRYLQEKISQILSGSSALMRVGADTAAIFLSNPDRTAVFSIYENHVNLFPGSISLQEWDYNKIFHFGIS
jgi:hypothetical protein